MRPSDALRLRIPVGEGAEIGEVASFGPIEDGQDLPGGEIRAGEDGEYWKYYIEF